MGKNNEEFKQKLKEEFGDADETKARIEYEKKKEELDEIKKILGEIYEDIIFILKEYCDLREDYYSLIALWVIGTYVYESFNTYPYLFINAMRGSGKTRLLKLIKFISNNGELVTSLKEAVLFRTARGKTLCIDEFEGIGKKENAPLRELLNACYKKGIKIQRMKKRKTVDGEDHVVESFEPYTPIAMANIWGMEEVLSDRCITLVLEKSNDVLKTKLMEDFEENLVISKIKSDFKVILVQLCSFFGEKTYNIRWNFYIKVKYNNTTYNTDTTHTTPTLLIKDKKNNDFWCSDDVVSMFNRVDSTGINGRDLELIFPLLIISHFLSDTLFEKTLNTCKRIVKSKKDEEMIESKDVSVMDFISQQLNSGFVSIKKLTSDFRNFMGDDDIDDKWINSKWLGRALGRLDLVVDKRRMRDGIQVTLNIPKAIRKIEMFRGSIKK